MYLHIGLNYLIKTRYIVAVCDIDNTTTSPITRAFLAEAEKKGQIVSATTELPKSFIVYQEKNKTIIYLTQFSTVTLQKRSHTEELQ